MPYLLLHRPGLGAQPALFDQGQALSQLEAQFASQLRGALKSVSDQVEKDMKEALIKAAAVQASTNIILAAIPVVGWAAAAVVSIAQSFSGAEYQKEAQEILAQAQHDIAMMQAESQSRISRKLGEVFQEEKQPAIDMVLQLAMDPSVGVGFVSKLRKEIKRSIGDPLHDAMSKVSDGIRDAIDDIGDAMQDGLDYVSGRIAKTEAREAAKKLKDQAREQVNAHEQRVMALVDTPVYRASLRNTIAEQLLQNPSIKQMVLEIGALQRKAGHLPGTAAVPTATTRSAAPLAVGAAALAALFLLAD